MDLLTSIVDSAVLRHGIGTLLSIIESVAKAHAIHSEKVDHGFFLKCHFPNCSVSKRTRETSTPTLQAQRDLPHLRRTWRHMFQLFREMIFSVSALLMPLPCIVETWGSGVWSFSA